MRELTNNELSYVSGGDDESSGGACTPSSNSSGHSVCSVSGDTNASSDVPSQVTESQIDNNTWEYQYYGDQGAHIKTMVSSGGRLPSGITGVGNGISFSPMNLIADLSLGY